MGDSARRFASTWGVALGVLTVTSAAFAAPAADGRRSLALVSVTQDPGSADETRTVEDLLLHALDATKRLRVIGRGDFEGMLALEARRQAAGCDDSSCMTEIAAALGADLVATAHIGQVDGGTVLSMKVMDVHTATVLVRAQASVDPAAGTAAACNDLAQQVLKALGLTPAEGLNAPLRLAPRWQLGVEALTDFPIDVGAKIWVEAPYRIRLNTTFGVLPGPYVDAINSTMVAAGAYNQDTANLIKAGLQNSFAWRLHVGWRPFRTRGAYFEAGYGLVALGGSLSAAQAIAAATGKAVPADAGSVSGYSVTSVLHMVDVELGWQWFIGKGLTLRAGVGCALTVAASSQVSPNFTPRAPALQAAFTNAAANYLDSTYTSYVFVPTISVAVGWRFLPWLEPGW